jgi:xanthine permease XanP
VMAAAMLFTCVFIMIGGIQIVSSRVLDARRTLVIGMGLMAFLVVSIFPRAFAGAPQWAQPLVSSPLVLATLVALLLNLVFRLGVTRTVGMTIDPATVALQDVANFVERNAGIWGARRDVASRVEYAVAQAVESIIGLVDVSAPFRLTVSYDEFDIDAALVYSGIALELPERPPTQEEILESEDGPRRLAGFMIRRLADKVQATSEGGTTTIKMHFRQ